MSVCDQLQRQLDTNRLDFDSENQENHPNMTSHSSSSTIVDSGLPFKLLQLFTLGTGIPKLQRSVQPNKTYLACVLFHEDRVLMTNEEVLPLLTIDETTPKNAYHDFNWLSKLSYNWADIPRLRSQMAKMNSSSDNFRLKLINAVAGMQDFLNGLGGDLGHPFHAPFFFHQNSSVVFCLVKHVRNFKSVVTLSLKWVPLSKAQKSSHNAEESRLNSSLRQQILFHQVSKIGLPRGVRFPDFLVLW